MSLVNTEIKVAEQPANVKEPTRKSPINAQHLGVKVRVVGDKLMTTSPRKAASQPRPQETRQFFQKESESGCKEMKSSDVDIVVLETNRNHKSTEAQMNVPGKQTQETSMEATNPSDEQTSEVTETKDVFDHIESSKPKSKFSQGTSSSPVSGAVNQGDTSPPSCSGNMSTRTSRSTSNLQQIPEFLGNFRKMFKSTSFTMPAVRTPRKSDTSVKYTNNGSEKENQAAIKTEVKVEAGSHQGAVKGEASMCLILCVSAVTKVTECIAIRLLAFTMYVIDHIVQLFFDCLYLMGEHTAMMPRSQKITWRLPLI